MRMLEVGVGRNPSIMMNSPNIDYLGIDKNDTCFPELENIFSADITKLKTQEMGEFDLVYGANVLGNIHSSNERQRIVDSSLGMLNKNGRLILIEYLSPDIAGLTVISNKIGGVVLTDEDPEFKQEWELHMNKSIGKVKQDLKLRKKFKILEKYA